MTHRALFAALSLTLTASASACDLDLPAGDVTNPEYWGDVFLNKYADDLVVGDLEPGPEPLAEPRVVLLITGVTIPAEWFAPMEARLVRDGFIPVVYEPPELLSGDLQENTELLAEVIDEVRADYGVDKIDILAECTGGLIARHYLQSIDESKVSRMVTFISPQHGVEKAPWANSIVGWPALDDLSPGSDFLSEVNDAPLPEHVPITSIYTCTDEYIQPYETSIIPGATNIGLCDGFVGHFEFFFDPDIYLVMHDALVQPVPGDAAAPDEPDDAPGDDDGTDADDDDDAPADADAPAVPGDDDDADDEVDADLDDEDAAIGCTAGGRPGAWSGLLVLFGIGAITRRRRR